ncbi:MAG: nicotinate (nicotinamide) nucleotide adenylyltransferase [candidate division WOR-3 bacterium]|nr:nicotinate (nicotinamide) nucleotide adenylyltransferase [candidate division WOR-3 bacterium]
MKIGIFGGAFNPIHIGHLITVEEVRQKLKLDKVLFVPTYNPPHKKLEVSYHHRRNMVELSIKGNPFFELCEIEKELGGISWTIETLKTLHKYYPKDKLYLILGSDQYDVLNTWKEPERLTKYAKLVIMPRPNAKCKVCNSKDKILVKISQIDIASKNIRKDLKQGKSVKYKVVDKVYNYIKNNKLYLA